MPKSLTMASTRRHSRLSSAAAAWPLILLGSLSFAHATTEKLLPPQKSTKMPKSLTMASTRRGCVRHSRLSSAAAAWPLFLLGCLSVAHALNLPPPAPLVPPRSSDYAPPIESGNDGRTNGPPLSVINLPTWSVRYGLPELRVRMKETTSLPLTVEYIDGAWGADFELHLVSHNEEFAAVVESPADVDGVGVLRRKDVPLDATSWTGNFTVEGRFLGETELHVELRRPHMPAERAQQTLHVRVLRGEDGLDTAFKITLGAFVLVMYINFGAVLDLEDLKRIVLRPVGPIIGMVGQFVIMPLLSFLIGYLVFPDQIELRLGLLFTGSGPAGGLSNIITVLLKGNINLSVTMTALSNLAAFGMMPLWVFTLGAVILEGGNFTIPYATIGTMSCTLMVPLIAGVLLQRYAPRVAKQLSKHLESASLLLILAIMVFAFIVNSFLFKLFTWRILLACSSLPWCGYVLGWLMAKVCRQSPVDSLTIAIETGIQNTGIAIFMLKFAFEQPQADITSVVPVANSVLTPLPLLAIYVYRVCRRRCGGAITTEPAKQQPVAAAAAATTAAATLAIPATLTANDKQTVAAAPATADAAARVESRDKGHDNLAADV